MTVTKSPLAIERAAIILTGLRPASFDETVRPGSLADGYAVQDETWRMSAGRVAGYKIGLTSAAAQKALDADEPAAGRLPPERVLHGPSRIPVHERHLCIVEPEIVFVLKADLVPGERPLTVDDVLACTGSLHAGIEVCDTRFDPAYKRSLADLVADNVNADYLIIGEPLPIATAAELATVPVRIGWEGQCDIVGSTASVLGNPAAAVAWLAAHLAARGEGLRAGMVVASGSCAGLVKVEAGKMVTAQFAESASATVTLVQSGSAGR